MVHWYFDEAMAVQRMRETQRKADQTQAWGLNRRARLGGWERIRGILGRGLVALGERLQQSDLARGSHLVSPSQCALR
jgi:hypothetical protein